MAGCVRRFLPIAGGCRVDDGDIQKPALLVELKIARLERSLARVMQDKVHALALRLCCCAKRAGIFLRPATWKPAGGQGFPQAFLQHAVPVVSCYIRLRPESKVLN